MSKRQTRRAAATPIMSGTISEQSCPACGAILPAPIGRLDDIPGQAHLRRAATVAVMGNHTITFIGVGASLPDALAYGPICRRGDTAASAHHRTDRTGPISRPKHRATRGGEGDRAAL